MPTSARLHPARVDGPPDSRRSRAPYVGPRGSPGSRASRPDAHAGVTRIAAERDDKGALLAFMAHELRQPLMAISSLAELLRDTQLSADQREMVDLMRRSVTGLGQMVTDVLDLARLEAGKLAIACSAFDVHAAVEHCVDLLAIRAAEKDLELVYTIDDAVPPRLIGDDGRLRQVLVNLVGNAIKYTERGSVHVAVSGAPGRAGAFELSVGVTDTGPGIPADELEGLFEPFAVGPGGGGAGTASTGLGLAICRELVGLMGGTCWAESTVGRGSTFRFTVATRAVEEWAAPSRVDPDVAGRRVLVVDDSELAGRKIVALVEQWGGRADAVTGAAQALDRLRAGERYDAILIDSLMPGLDGRALAAAIRGLPDGATVPLLLMSTLQSRGVDAATTGPVPRFAAYVSKPVKPARLREAVGGVLVVAVPAEDPPAPTPETAAGHGRSPVPATAPLEERRADPGAEAGSAAGVLSPTRIVVVDDDALVRQLLERVLRRAGATVISTGRPTTALDLMRRERPDVVILDALMPGLDGFELCRQLKRDPATQLIPVLLATGLDAEEHRIRALEVGADDLLAKPLDVSRLITRVKNLARTKRFTDRLEPVEAVIVAMAHCIEGKDPGTHGHCERLADYAERLAHRLGMDQADVDALRLAGIVHDIGKVAVPDAILLKPGPLTDEEWEIMRRHPLEGERICAGLASFRSVIPIIRHHHERLDGRGYPDRLAGDDIPLAARVLQVVDIYDALTTSRPYRVPLGPREALDYLAGEVERGWRDPRVFAEFRRMIEAELEVNAEPEPAVAAGA